MHVVSPPDSGTPTEAPKAPEDGAAHSTAQHALLPGSDAHHGPSFRSVPVPASRVGGGGHVRIDRSISDLTHNKRAVKSVQAAHTARQAVSAAQVGPALDQPHTEGAVKSDVAEGAAAAADCSTAQQPLRTADAPGGRQPGQQRTGTGTGRVPAASVLSEVCLSVPEVCLESQLPWMTFVRLKHSSYCPGST